jgi:hypothetical protein
MGVSRSAYYAWRKSLARSKPLNFTVWRLRQRLKILFDESRGSLGSRGLVKRLRQEGFTVGRYRVRTWMKILNLTVQQRRAYKVTTVVICADNAQPIIRFSATGPAEGLSVATTLVFVRADVSF